MYFRPPNQNPEIISTPTSVVNARFRLYLAYDNYLPLNRLSCSRFGSWSIRNSPALVGRDVEARPKSARAWHVTYGTSGCPR